MVPDPSPTPPRWTPGFARRAIAAAVLLVTAVALSFVALPAAMVIGLIAIITLLQPRIRSHLPPQSEPPEARAWQRDPFRVGAIVFLGIIALYVAIRYRFYLLAPLVVLEIMYTLLRPTWASLDALVDAGRLRLGPAKKIPSALIGLPLLFLGLFLGAFYERSVLWLANGVDAVVSQIASVAPYVIFFTLTPAIASTLVTGRAGKFAVWVTGAYATLTLLAGLLAVLIVVPLFGVRLYGPGAPGAPAVQSNLLELLFTSNAFLAIFAAVGTALMIHGLGLPGLFATTRFFGGKLVDLLGDLLKILLPLILFALGAFIPTELARGIDRARAAGSPEGAGWVGNFDIASAYFVAVGALVLILGIWIFGQAAIVMRYTKFPFVKFLRDYFGDVYLYAWSTASSSATIPLNLERTGSGLRVRQNVREFIIPLGATVHLDGTMIGGMVTSVVAAQLVGYTPTVLDLFYVLIPLMVVTVGAPGIPGGLAIVGGPVIANLLPLPPGTQVAFTAIFVGFNIGLSDQFRSGVNATGNGVLCRLFEYWYPRKFALPGSEEARGLPSPLEPRPSGKTPKAASAPKPRRTRTQA
jgi:Na+/H+-dicarboxylate symporter